MLRPCFDQGLLGGEKFLLSQVYLSVCSLQCCKKHRIRAIRSSAVCRTTIRSRQTVSVGSRSLEPSRCDSVLVVSALWTLLNLWLIKRGISGRLSGSSTLDPERPSIVVVIVVMEYVVLLKAYSFYYVHGRVQRAATVSHAASKCGFYCAFAAGSGLYNPLRAKLERAGDLLFSVEDEVLMIQSYLSCAFSCL